MIKPDYDTTIARIAGNLLSGSFCQTDLIRSATDLGYYNAVVRGAVNIAKDIASETRKLNPPNIFTAETKVSACADVTVAEKAGGSK